MLLIIVYKKQDLTATALDAWKTSITPMCVAIQGYNILWGWYCAEEQILVSLFWLILNWILCCQLVKQD